ncbi:MAG: SLC13 family permease [Dehalococcoidales bacterium]|nr:SLC13 family permease [Dehalococcoidales bacterium]
MLDPSQIVTLCIFIGVFTFLIIGKVQRFIPVLIGAALTILVVFLGILRSPDTAIGVLNFAEIGRPTFWIAGHEPIMAHGVNWQTIFFIGGMMVLVEGLRAVGFFRWLCLYTARMVNYRIIPISIVFMLLAGVMSMFIDSITVLLFMASVIIELARILKFDPVPLIIATIFAANVGGSATMAGDPPNIIIGTSLGYTFNDFVVNTGPIAWTGMAAAVGYFYWRLRRDYAHTAVISANTAETQLKPQDAIINHRLYKIQLAIFITVVFLIITHAQSGLSMAMIGIIAALATIAAMGKETPSIMKGVDWRTLLFFIGLFICVGGLEETGILHLIAGFIGTTSGGNPFTMITIILWGSACASAVVDNIPFAATMVPIIVRLSQATGVALPSLAWPLALGADIGGNATPIGASANVVGVAIAEKAGYRVSWGRFLKYSLPITIIVLSICMLMLVTRYV